MVSSGFLLDVSLDQATFDNDKRHKSAISRCLLRWIVESSPFDSFTFLQLFCGV